MNKRIVYIVSHPVNSLVDVLHIQALTRLDLHIPKKHLRWPIGVAFMVTGSGLAVMSGGWGLAHGAHVVVDMVAYGIHGAGAVPFVNIIVRRFKMEGDE